MSRIEGENGDRATNAIKGAFDRNKKRLTADAADLWFQESSDHLQEAASMRAELGRQKGRAGRAQTGLHAILKGAYPPQFNEREGIWEFGFPHEGAIFQEFGAMPHEIRARKAEVLAFEWPDAPQEVKEQFEHTEGDLVFFESINHPGIPAIGFVRYGRDRAKALIEQGNNRTEMFMR